MKTAFGAPVLCLPPGKDLGKDYTRQMNKTDKIYITAIAVWWDQLSGVPAGAGRVMRIPIGRTLAQLDLKNQAEVVSFFEKERPDHVILAAAKVGVFLPTTSIGANFSMIT